ncbi:MAG: hypothetical protein FWC34_09535 [Bacteroidetes bacterium]|nr:hypothetical protein [Bacteroidota bacterium]MCL2302051.1 hypothetical protein [Lentimicrobiaceae bacterium]
MTKEHFTAHFLTRFEKDFAERMVNEIQKQALQELLISVLRDVIYFNPQKAKSQSAAYDYLRIKKKTEREQIAFRSAYLLETLYFKDKNILLFLKDDFIELLSIITNESAKRHFGKILTDLLKNNVLIFSEDEYELLAETVASWVVAPRTRVAVQIWAFEALLLLRKKAQIGNETIGYLLEILTQDSSPAIKCRLKKWKKRGVHVY